MRVLFLAWKDINHPAAGGAELVLWELAKRLVGDSHEVTVLTCGYDGAADRENLDGIDVIRVGNNRYAHSFQALIYYIRHLRNKYDAVIETANTAPYFAVFFGRRSKRYLLYHQLAREIWFYETKPPLSYVGYYLLEPVATFLLSLSGVSVITVSESTKKDLVRFGFRQDLIHIISEGIKLKPVADLKSIKKFDKPTLLSLGALRAMKRTADQVAAFEMAKASIPDLQLKIAGSSDDPYGKDVLQRIAASQYKEDIEYLGKVSESEKTNLMQRCHLILVTSIKEGWGLIVTEAASQGAPAVVYDVDGLRDSVRDGETGVVNEVKPAALASSVTSTLQNTARYERIRKAAWEWSKEITFDRAYSDFRKVVDS
jgi:glycosyltransferase involved in cell wall biosynthesis